MDKNTLVGFLLIIGIFIGFFWITQPTAEQIEAKQRYNDSIMLVNQQQAQLAATIELEQEQPEANVVTNSKTDSVNVTNTFGAFSSFIQGTDSLLILENEKLRICIQTKGGVVHSVQLKEYNTHDQQPLMLTDGTEEKTNFTFVTADNRIVNSDELYFEPIWNAQGKSLTMRLAFENNSHIDFEYTLAENDYLLSFKIAANNVEDLLSRRSNLLDMEWNTSIRQQELGRKFENRYAALYYKFIGDDDVESLSKDKNEEKDIPNRLHWIASKGQFFSAVLIADDYFTASKISSEVSTEEAYLKSTQATMGVSFDPKGEKKTGFTYYFGPNKYKLFKSYDKGDDKAEKWYLEKLIPLGWGIFGWVNMWLVIPVFNFLEGFISSYGIIILLLTIFIKLILLPLTYKSYISTAKMKVLRPQIEEINAKIPADKAMERQQATMALYKKVGVSPMGGCLPMMLQMPILFALFTFFPASIELRQESFLWAQDLSTFDAIVSWDTYIPIISTYYGNHISLFCVLMAITNIVYTKINGDATGSTQQMPGMKYVMYLMPLMFLVFFNEYASGLSYYYFISTLFTILQTYMFRLFVNDEKLLKQLNANKKNPSKKSRFAEKLDQLQKQQVELKKQQRNKR
ncbi:MAG: membrane protein insertase YidC [Paludibacteraceae bacterium]|nr:membrane protein insertase YidC [Paludibacteraceae bacterium]